MKWFEFLWIKNPLENRIPPRWFKGRNANEGTNNQGVGRTKITNKGWWGIQRLNHGRTASHLGLKGHEEEMVFKEPRESCGCRRGPLKQLQTHRGAYLLQTNQWTNQPAAWRQEARKRYPCVFPSITHVLPVPPLAENKRKSAGKGTQVMLLQSAVNYWGMK